MNLGAESRIRWEETRLGGGAEGGGAGGRWQELDILEDGITQ